MKETCESCKFFEKHPEGHYDPRHIGSCRIVLPPEAKTFGKGTQVSRDQSCSLHRPLPPEDGKTRVVL